jgi:hypothetical protein
MYVSTSSFLYYSASEVICRSTELAAGFEVELNVLKSQYPADLVSGCILL